jgi:hypothetical protein
MNEFKPVIKVFSFESKLADVLLTFQEKSVNKKEA